MVEGSKPETATQPEPKPELDLDESFGKDNRSNDDIFKALYEEVSGAQANTKPEQTEQPRDASQAESKSEEPAQATTKAETAAPADSSDTKQKLLNKKYSELTKKLSDEHPLKVKYEALLLRHESLEEVEKYENSREYKQDYVKHLDGKREELTTLYENYQELKRKPRESQDKVLIKDTLNELLKKKEDLQKDILNGRDADPDVKLQSKFSAFLTFMKTQVTNIAQNIGELAVGIIKETYQLTKNTILSVITSDQGKEGRSTEYTPTNVSSADDKIEEAVTVEKGMQVEPVMGVPVEDVVIVSDKSKEDRSVKQEPDRDVDKTVQTKQTPNKKVGFNFNQKVDREASFNFSPATTPNNNSKSKDKGPDRV